MSMPAIFFVADRATAEQVRLNHSLPPENVAERASMDPLTLATFWSILAARDDDPLDLMDRFTEIRSSQEEWTSQIPDAFVALLASASEPALRDAAARWMQTDEMIGWSAPEALDLLRDVQRVARRAQELRQPLFLYTSL